MTIDFNPDLPYNTGTLKVTDFLISNKIEQPKTMTKEVAKRVNTKK